MSHLEAAKRFLEARRGTKPAESVESYELNELSPSTLPFPAPAEGRPLPWSTLVRQRWGGPDGIVIDRPDRARMLAAVEAIQGEPSDESGEIHPRHLFLTPETRP